MLLRYLLVFTAGTSLMACDPGDERVYSEINDFDFDEPEVPQDTGAITSLAFSDLVSRASALEAQIANNSFTPLGTFSNGTAVYEGFASVYETEESVPVIQARDLSYLAVGQVSLNVQLANGRAQGEASNFYEVSPSSFNVNEDLVADTFSQLGSTNGTSIDGSLVYLQNGEILGSLTKEGGEVATYAFIGVTDFRGDAGQRLTGTAEGISQSPSRSDRQAASVFIAEQP